MTLRRYPFLEEPPQVLIDRQKKKEKDDQSRVDGECGAPATGSTATSDEGARSNGTPEDGWTLLATLLATLQPRLWGPMSHQWSEGPHED